MKKQPISTAPKDGTTIKGYYHSGDEITIHWATERYIRIGRNGPLQSCGAGWAMTESGYEDYPVDTPTHWSPL